LTRPTLRSAAPSLARRPNPSGFLRLRRNAPRRLITSDATADADYRLRDGGQQPGSSLAALRFTPAASANCWRDRCVPTKTPARRDRSAVGSGLLVDRRSRSSICTMPRGAGRSARNQLADLLVRDDASAFGVDGDVHRLRDTDRIRDLHLALPRDSRGDDILCDVARRIGGRAVDLGRVLAGKTRAAVWQAPPYVSTMILRPVRPQSPAARDDEAPGRIDQVLVSFSHSFGSTGLMICSITASVNSGFILSPRLISGRAASTERRCRSSAACRRRSAS